MRDIQMVLERYGSWASSPGNEIYYSSIAAGFKGLLPSTHKSRPSCCDDDGLIINTAMSYLKKHDPHLCLLIEWYYILGIPVRRIGTRLGVSHTHVLKRLQAAEGFIDGCLSGLGKRLEIESECQKEVV